MIGSSILLGGVFIAIGYLISSLCASGLLLQVLPLVFG